MNFFANLRSCQKQVCWKIDFQFSFLIFPQTFDATSSVQNDVTLTNEELALYNQLLLANNYLLEPRNPEVIFN